MKKLCILLALVLSSCAGDKAIPIGKDVNFWAVISGTAP